MMIVFNSLNREDMHKIIDISLGKLFKRIEALGYKIELTDKAKDYVAEKGYDPKYGARPLNRAIQKYIEDPIAEEILKAEVNQGDVIMVDHEEGKEELTFTSKKSGKKNKPNLASDEIDEDKEPTKSPDADKTTKE